MSKFQGVLKMFMLGVLKTISKTVLKYEKNTITLYGTCRNWAADFVFLLRFCTRKRSETYICENYIEINRNLHLVLPTLPVIHLNLRQSMRLLSKVRDKSYFSRHWRWYPKITVTKLMYLHFELHLPRSLRYTGLSITLWPAWIICATVSLEIIFGRITVICLYTSSHKSTNYNGCKYILIEYHFLN